MLDSATTLTSIWASGTQAAGTYSGSNKDLVIQTGSDKPHYLAGHSYSKLPPELLTVQDGQSVTVSGSSIEEGLDVLWLFYEAGGGTHGFVIAGPQLGIPPGGGFVGEQPGDATSRGGLSTSGGDAQSGATVKPSDEDGNILPATVSGMSGEYWFGGVEGAPPQVERTVPTDGPDSEVVVGEETTQFALVASQSATVADVGLYPSAGAAGLDGPLDDPSWMDREL